jgi:hypothetical protein
MVKEELFVEELVFVGKDELIGVSKVTCRR